MILERDAIKWFKPAKGQFQIFYKLGTEQPEYIPDFVVETDDFILMAETKAKDEMKSAEVLAKADAAVQWCSGASMRLTMRSRSAVSLGNTCWCRMTAYAKTSAWWIICSIKFDWVIEALILG